MSKSYFKKGLILYFFGNFSSKLISLLLLPIFTIYLSQEEYGLFDILNTVVLFLVPIVGAQIFEGIIRYLLESNSEQNRRSIISSSFLFLCVNILIVNLITIVVKQYIQIPHADWFLVYFNFFLVNFYLQRVARGLKQQAAFAISGVINTLTLAIVSVLLLILADLKTEALLIAYGAGSCASVIYLLVILRFHRYLSFREYNQPLIKKLLIYSVPLLFDAVIWWTMNLSDRLILGYFNGTDDVGIYGVANRFAALLTFLNHIFYLVWQEYAIINSAKTGNTKEFTNLFTQYLKVQFSGVLVMLPTVKLFIHYFIDPSFQESYSFVPILLFGAMFSSFAAFYGLFYQIDENTKGAMYTSLVAGLLNISLNILLIPIYGIWAAAGTTLLSFFILWGIRSVKFSSIIQISGEISRYLVFGILLTIITILIYYNDSMIIDVANLICAVLFFGFVNRKLLKKFLKSR